jgi:predicted GIY-YIG superfamily endonuclease
MNWFVYIAKSRVNFYYTGITTNPVLRLAKHNLGRGSKMAREQGPFVLVYTSKPFTNKSEARTREVQIKGWSRAKKEKLIQGLWT